MLEVYFLESYFSDSDRCCDAEILTGRRSERLDAWMGAVEADGLPHLHRFVRGLRRDPLRTCVTCSYHTVSL
jgi:hypothetical protein